MFFEISKDSVVQKNLVAPRKVVKVISGYNGAASDDVIIKWSASTQSIGLGDTIHCYCDVYTKIDITSIESCPHICLDDCYVEKKTLFHKKNRLR